MTMDLPKGLSEELASRLYGRVTVSWSSSPFVFSAERSECRAWVERGAASMSGDTYDTGTWPTLTNVVRRGTDNSVRVFQYSDGSVFEQTT